MQSALRSSLSFDRTLESPALVEAEGDELVIGLLGREADRVGEDPLHGFDVLEILFGEQSCLFREAKPRPASVSGQ